MSVWTQWLTILTNTSSDRRNGPQSQKTLVRTLLEKTKPGWPTLYSVKEISTNFTGNLCKMLNLRKLKTKSKNANGNNCANPKTGNIQTDLKSDREEKNMQSTKTSGLHCISEENTKKKILIKLQELWEALCLKVVRFNYRSVRNRNNNLRQLKAALSFYNRC